MAEAAIKLSLLEGNKLFLTEFGKHACHGRSNKFVLFHVALSYFQRSVSEDVKSFLRTQYNVNFKLAVQDALMKHPCVFPLLEISSRVYIPVPTKKNLENYIKELGKRNAQTQILESDFTGLAQLVHDVDKKLILIFYNFVKKKLLESGDKFVKLNEINNEIKKGLEQLHNIYGFGGERKFVTCHPTVFTFKKINSVNYVSLVPLIDVKGYIETLKMPIAKCLPSPTTIKIKRKITKDSRKYPEKDCVEFAVDRFKKTIIEYKNSTISVVDFHRSIVSTFPEDLSCKIKQKYGSTPFRKFFAAHETIFIPVFKKKNVKLQGYKLATDDILSEYLAKYYALATFLNQTEKNPAVPNLKPTEEHPAAPNLKPITKNSAAPNLKPTVKNLPPLGLIPIEIKLEIECLKCFYNNNFVDFEKGATIEKISNAIAHNFKKIIKDRLSTRMNLLSFLHLHHDVFPMKINNNKLLYYMVSQEEFDRYIWRIQVQQMLKLELTKMNNNSKPEISDNFVLPTSNNLTEEKTCTTEQNEVSNISFTAMEHLMADYTVESKSSTEDLQDVVPVLGEDSMSLFFNELDEYQTDAINQYANFLEQIINNKPDPMCLPNLDQNAKPISCQTESTGLISSLYLYPE